MTVQTRDAPVHKTVLTFKPGSSFPARAKSNVDLPEPGGPNSRVILAIAEK